MKTNLSASEINFLLQEPALEPPAGIEPAFDGSFSPPRHVLIVATLATVLCTICITLRMISRGVYHKYEWDDYTSGLAWVVFIIYACLSYVSAKRGAGTHQWNLRLGELIKLQKTTFVVGILYGPAIVMTVLSILLHYKRIFVPNRHSTTSLFYAIHIQIVLSISLCIIGTFVGAFMCIPTSKAWNPFVRGYCMDHNNYLLAVSVLRILTEFAILLTPIRSIWSLHMKVERKIAMVLLLGAGIFTCASSIIRLIYTIDLARTTDYSYAIAMVGLWSNIEISLGISCGCVPAFPTLFKALTSTIKTKLFANNNQAISSKGVDRIHSLAWKIPTIWGSATRDASIGMGFPSRARSKYDDSRAELARGSGYTDSKKYYNPERARWSQAHVRDEASSVRKTVSIKMIIEDCNGLPIQEQ